jgi:hypothetical protein
MSQQLKKYSIEGFAKLKGCSRQTIHKHLSLFEVKQEGRIKFITFNDFAKKWQPDRAAQLLGKKRFPKN